MSLIELLIWYRLRQLELWIINYWELNSCMWVIKSYCTKWLLGKYMPLPDRVWMGVKQNMLVCRKARYFCRLILDNFLSIHSQLASLTSNVISDWYHSNVAISYQHFCACRAITIQPVCKTGWLATITVRASGLEIFR